MIAALYVDPRGPYQAMRDVDCWDEARDAKKYDGPWPVIAHPPCGPWGRLKALSKYQDQSCGPRAVEQVRKFGGVLEHPANSTLWRHCLLPWPGELPDAHGGSTIEVNQVSWGHSCKKATWLYCVRVHVSGVRSGGAPTKRITNGRGPQLPRVGSLEARLTPPLFAEWLVSLAKSVHIAR